MSATSGVNVLRYSALAVGVAYGFYHQRTITQHVRSQQAEREYKHKEQLINQAKAEFAKSKQPVMSKVAEKAAGGPKLDLNDPNFDIEALINSVMEQKA
ncbi:ATP synthase E chain-domain-containing protein [Coniochaeta sp. 2T2.1]|nr:ATP synthase E chain-domain-containing protein [Coniochaeta sp. 2T2.1]